MHFHTRSRLTGVRKICCMLTALFFQIASSSSSGISKVARKEPRRLQVDSEAVESSSREWFVQADGNVKHDNGPTAVAAPTASAASASTAKSTAATASADELGQLALTEHWSVAESITIIAAGGIKDTVKIYKKDGSDECAVVFSTTNDNQDIEQQMAGLSSGGLLCGLDGVHSGLVEEMDQYMNDAKWQGAMESLKSCTYIYSVGHSMGGAMASLFAFCANSADGTITLTDDGGHSRSDVRLVTFGAPAPAKTRLYNRDENTCFVGARRFVAAPPSSLGDTFKRQVFDVFYTFLTALASLNMSVQVDIDTFSNAMDANSDSTQMDAASNLMQRWFLPLAGCLTPKDDPMIHKFITDESVLNDIVSKVHALAAGGELKYSYDPLPELYQLWGFQHPLVTSEPRAHPGVSSAQGDMPTRVECNGNEQTVEEYSDKMQVLFGTAFHIQQAKSWTSLPNHQLECLLGGGVGCDAPDWR